MSTQLSLDFESGLRQQVALQESRNDSARRAARTMSGKRKEVFDQICIAGLRGLTMREMAILKADGRGINCWTQPFMDLREWGLIRATEERRDGGCVHVATGKLSIDG